MPKRNERSFLVTLVALAFILFSIPARAQTYQSPPVPTAQWWEDRAGDGGGTHFPSAAAACMNQMQVFNPGAGYLPPDFVDDGTAQCNWDRSLPGANTILPSRVVAVCPYGDRLTIDRQCIHSASVTSHGQTCDCDAQSQGPQPEVGNPVKLADGAKVQREVDYSSADGLFAVRRNYISRQGNDVGQARPTDIPGFGRNWHGIIPGRLAVVGDPNYLATFEYISASGAVLYFNAGAYSDTNVWTIFPTQSTRATLSMVAVPAINRFDYFRNGIVAANDPGEMRLEMAQGNYILFRRSGTYNVAKEHRYLVPVEQGYSNGYKVFFDYPDVGSYPNKIRDSLGRQMTLA